MPRIRTDINTNDIIKLYESGVGYYKIANTLGCSPPLVRRRLVSAGVRIRSQGEQLKLTQEARGAEWRAQNTKSAHDAVRGMTRTEKDLCKRAITKEANATISSRNELSLIEWLSNKIPEKIVPQKAIGKYNIDIAIPELRIAVEVFGGHWHLSGKHANTLPARHKYIFDRGWVPVYIWATSRKPLSFPVADYLVTLCDRSRDGESLIGEKHVIWGNGQAVTAPTFKLDHLSGVFKP